MELNDQLKALIYSTIADARHRGVFIVLGVPW
jgi:hypothetical protein